MSASPSASGRFLSDARVDRRTLLTVGAASLVLAACGGSRQRGPNLTKALDGLDTVGARSTQDELKLVTESGDNSLSDSSVRLWKLTGTPSAAATSLEAKHRSDNRVESNNDVFLLYPSGTVWFTDQSGGAVVLFADNDRAYRSHSGILVANRGWGNTINRYQTSRSSSGGGNGFRGGGGRSGK